ncbi:transcriptional regulator, AbrB family [Pelosinus sp. UFO1]|nr:transcriptional regulator, AbrB family [Pelosinus sp. UFO1]
MMKSTGIVRKVDELGRVVIPIELRRTLDIAEKDALEIYVDSDRIILRKYEPAVDSPRALIREFLESEQAIVSPDLINRMREVVSK